jgi:hypothetical protein
MQMTVREQDWHSQAVPAMIGEDLEVVNSIDPRICNCEELGFKNSDQGSCATDTHKDLKFLVVGDGGSFQSRFSYHECVAFLNCVLNLRVDGVRLFPKSAGQAVFGNK